MEGEREAHGVRDGIANKEKQSVEHERLQDFAWAERKKRLYMDTWKETEKWRCTVHNILWEFNSDSPIQTYINKLCYHV